MSYLERILPEQEVDDEVDDALPGTAPGKRSLTAGFRRDRPEPPPRAAAPDALDGLGFLSMDFGRALGVTARVDASDDAAVTPSARP
ncbi:MAG: hypothetical protein K8M05_11785, partial [Deltaproteobacteria bacterium]|nr:hypothetical protein [Kofleriaceae bacterium]